MTSSRLPRREDFPSSLTLNIVPCSSSTPVNVLILLHGLGDTNRSFTQFAQNLNLPETACVALQGFKPIPAIFTGSDTPAFHWAEDVLVDEATGEIDSDSGFEGTARILRDDVVQPLMGTCGYAARNLFFFGFGQGAMLPLFLAVQESQLEFGGIVSIGGKLSSRAGGEKKSRTPVLVCGGSRSREITRGALDRLKERFPAHEYVKWAKADDGMPQSREEMLPVMRFFARRLLSRRGVPEGAVEV